MPSCFGGSTNDLGFWGCRSFTHLATKRITQNILQERLQDTTCLLNPGKLQALSKKTVPREETTSKKMRNRGTLEFPSFQAHCLNIPRFFSLTTAIHDQSLHHCVSTQNQKPSVCDLQRMLLLRNLTTSLSF